MAANGIKNGASFAFPGFPNGSIAQGSIFSVFGTGLGPATGVPASSFPLPTNLGGTSATVTVNGTTVNCIILYASDGQVNAILPSNTPVGTGNLVVSFNGNSSPSTIKVVSSSPGIFAVNQQGTGPGVIQDANGAQNALTFAFNPGQTVVIWGTGLGPISGDDASTPPTGNIPNVTVTANIAGKDAVVQYSGRSASAGEDQINVTIPDGVSGCYVPVYIVAKPANGTAVTSNFVTMSVAASGKTCSDPNFPNVTSANGYRTGTVSLTSSNTSISMAGQTATIDTDDGGGGFSAFDPTALATVGSFSFVDITVGSCSVIQSNGGGSGTTNSKVLDAGPLLNVSGPNGAKQMPKAKDGFYSGQFSMSTMIPGFPTLPGQTPPYLTPGNYTIDNGNGGADVGAFKLNITAPPKFTWNEANTLTSVDRTQPLTLTWTGGDPNAQVVAVGTSVADPNNSSVYIAFECIAKDSDLKMTVPPAILSLLPPSATLSGGIGGGSLIMTTTNTVTGSASGLDNLIGAFSYIYPKVGITYK